MKTPNAKNLNSNLNIPQQRLYILRDTFNIRGRGVFNISMRGLIPCKPNIKGVPFHVKLSFPFDSPLLG